MCLLLLFPLIYHANGVLELVQIHRRRSCCTNSCQKQQWISQSRANTQLVTVEQHRVCEGISIISLSFLSKCGLWIIPVLSFIRGFFFFLLINTHDVWKNKTECQLELYCSFSASNTILFWSYKTLRISTDRSSNPLFNFFEM